MRWVEFDTQIKVNNKIESIGYTEIQPKPEAIHPIANLSYVQNIKLRHNKNEENIWLLTQSGIRKENFQKIADDGKVDSISTIECFNAENRRYEQIEECGNISGLTKLRLDGNVVKVFVLPDEANITREIGRTTGKIIVHKIDKIEEFTKTRNTYQKEFNYNEANLANPTYPICINIDDSQKIVIDVVYPWKDRQVRVFGNNIIKENVPIKFASKYKLMIFDNDGVRVIEDRQALEKYNRKIHTENNQYHVGAEENLEFVFMDTDGTEYPLSIKRNEGRNGVRYYLTDVPADRQGVIFQTLKNKSSELVYYKHFYIDCNDRCDFHGKMGNILPFLKCEEHNLYYDVLLYPEMITPEWFFAYCEDCIKQNRIINYKHLWEAARDCEVDWMLKFPRAEWYKAMNSMECDYKKEWVVELFRRHPQYYSNDLECFVQSYWDLNWNCRAPQNRSDERKKFLFFVTKCQQEDNKIIYYDNNYNKRELNWQIPSRIPNFVDTNIEEITN